VTEQEQILADLRFQRLSQELKGPTAIGKLHGANMNADIPANMMAVWNAWWDQPFDPAATPVPERQGNGAYMFRVGKDQATYSRDGIRSFDVCRDTPLMVFANLDPELGAFWEKGFPGFKFVYLNS
jgi:hypothetical protein